MSYKYATLILAIFIVLIAIYKLFTSKNNKTSIYLYSFIATTTMVIVQVIAIDVGITKKYPFLLFFYLPYQQLSPVLFIMFTSLYLQTSILKKYYKILLLPFVLFLILYTVLKINIISGYALFSKEIASHINAEWDENFAVFYSIVLGFFNYHLIISYEKSIGNLPYNSVIKKTQWLKIANFILLVLCFIWVGIIAYKKITPDFSGHSYYYPLWLLFLFLYIYVFIFGSKQPKNSKKTTTITQKVDGLNKIFNLEELQKIQGTDFRATEILSFFATSLFDKTKPDDVLWSIVENCIAKLELEDAVIYLLDKDQKTLVQKAAFGNKDQGERKILSPITLTVGEGIVGSVAKNKTTELINNINNDPRYVVDDCKRNSELAVPILFKNTLIGVLDSEHSTSNFFQQEHIFLFELIAKLTAVKLNQLQKNSKTTLTNDNVYFTELQKLISEKRIYKNPNLSLTTVAEQLSISSNYLSQLINQVTQTSFTDYINSYRVNEAKEMLKNSTYKNYTIVAIALEAGFNSKSAFYTAFKKVTGKTPTDYRKNPTSPES